MRTPSRSSVQIYLNVKKTLHSEEMLLIWLFVICFDVASQGFPVFGSLPAIIAALLQAEVDLHVP